MKVVFTGGGTAGHVTPNLALIESFQRDGVECFYIGSKVGIEATLVSGLNLDFYGIAMATALANASCSLVPMRIELDSPINALSILASATLTPCARRADAHRRTNS